MPAPDYELLAGTTSGETRNEIFNKHGLLAYETAKYGWHHVHINDNVTKAYNLVSGSTVQMLVATISYPNIERIIPTQYRTVFYQDLSGSFIQTTGSIDSYTGSYFERVNEDMVTIEPPINFIITTASLNYVVDRQNPSELEFLWYDANIPFLDKDIIDKQGISYVLQ